jgi:hypothetical protein
VAALTRRLARLDADVGPRPARANCIDVDERLDLAHRLAVVQLQLIGWARASGLA